MLFHDLESDQILLLRNQDGSQGSGMSHGNLPLFHHSLHTFIQLQQPEGIGDDRPAFGNTPGNLLLGQAEFLHQPLIGPGLLHGIQVLSLQVLNQGKLHDLLIIIFPDYDRHFLQSGLHAGPPSALARDDLIISFPFLDHDRLDQSVLADRICQFLQGILVKGLSGLAAIGLDLGDPQGRFPAPAFRPVPLQIVSFFCKCFT